MPLDMAPSPPGWYVMLDLPGTEDDDLPILLDCPVPRADDRVRVGGVVYGVVQVVWHLTPDPDADPDAVHTPWAQVVLGP